jgi:SAM-dependent methyltransferase
METDPAVSTWRQALAENWEEMRGLTDWMGIPAMHDHVAELHTGAIRTVGGDWVDHSMVRHLLPLVRQLAIRDGDPDRKLSLVSFGCGTGHIEQAVLKRGWPIGRIVCREYDPALLDRARTNLQGLCPDQDFQPFDYNRPEAVGYETFDVAFFCHSMHHCTDIERFLIFLNAVVSQDGVIMGLDYFGPSRLQVTYDVKRLLDEVFESFPEHLRLNLQTGDVEANFTVGTIAEVTQGDPSEAPRSSDLRSLLFSTFPVREVSPMGGTLLRPLLACRAGNFRNVSDHCILKLVMMLERELIRAGRVASDNLYFVLGRSDRLG